MAENNVQVQIDEVNRKLDRVLEFMEYQSRKREEFDDLMEDVSIVAKDVVRNSVNILDKAQVDLDSCGLSCLLIKLLQNLGTFHEMLDMMESARDFMKDVTPILHQVGLDAVNKMNELDQKGYFEFIKAMGNFLDKMVQTIKPEDFRRIEQNMEGLAAILRNLSEPALIAALNKATLALTTVKMDDNLDNRSMWKLLKEMRSPEIRKTVSYSLRLLQAINS